MRNLRISLPNNATLPKLVPLFIPLAILTLSDAVLSYTVPIYAQTLFSNEFIAGLVISFSSVVGLTFDFLSRRLLGSKGFSFFIKTTFTLSILFAYSLGLSFVQKHIFILSMAVWGIYYETLAFSNFKFIKTNVNTSDYTYSWGFINMVRALMYATGPILATFMISFNLKLPSLICGTFVLVEFLAYLFLFKGHSKMIPNCTAPSPRVEMKVWGIFFKRVYPLWLLNFTLVLIDASFWTVGVLMAESFSHTSPISKFLIPIYMLPAVIVSPLSQTISAHIGKKRLAIMVSIIASVFLMFVGVASGINKIVLAVFSYSVLASLAFPAIYASYEDYVSRVGKFDTDLIGLEQSSTSVAYIIGPALAGFISTQIGGQGVFSILGIFLAFMSIFALVTTPKKIKMPQAELSKVS